MEHAVAEHRYGKPILVQPRLGQGAFRLLVTDAYQRRCAVTGERTLPVLDAAHIRPYAELGPHRLENGILLRKDLHALFDAGYVTVTPSLELRVSRRIREEFENGRDYYALERSSVRLPLPPPPPPSAEYLEWARRHSLPCLAAVRRLSRRGLVVDVVEVGEDDLVERGQILGPEWVHAAEPLDPVGRLRTGSDNERLAIGLVGPSGLRLLLQCSEELRSRRTRDEHVRQLLTGEAVDLDGHEVVAERRRAPRESESDRGRIGSGALREAPYVCTQQP